MNDERDIGRLVGKWRRHDVRTATTRRVQGWLDHWAGLLPTAKIGTIELRDGMHVVSESLHRHRYKFLWDLLFDNHPHGGYCRGKWEALGTNKPVAIPT